MRKLALQTLYPKKQGEIVHSPIPLGAAVCHLVNIIMVLLTVISSVQRHDHWWFYQRDMLTSIKNQFGMSKSPDSLSAMGEAGFQTMGNLKHCNIRNFWFLEPTWVNFHAC